MQITINGESRTVEGSPNLSELVQSLGLQVSATVIERNGEIVDKSQFEQIQVEPGDQLELVRFVGGG
ncbi:MAG: thiamine biosynthesis protein ThiS [Deltaproteobacteria bacterium CG2_30_63_29]|nr:MAG: thiamine biosynthesis protein ThiS [Deltaproteobacteria bacterium CG2_30_63_29]PIV98050.1 MAG: thiamine biosynthesis protein ThiS [Deltaproteobacteria bacterium CG17_big_fil_post_rev_8_21_14_2_50_63_7]PJB48229.1 MAG: thiamine biosynthesis protein ThiS [Deltaproteobacteria bacterium CG_4_9_14_3_um_filter_63_12]